MAGQQLFEDQRPPAGLQAGRAQRQADVVQQPDRLLQGVQQQVEHGQRDDILWRRRRQDTCQQR